MINSNTPYTDSLDENSAISAHPEVLQANRKLLAGDLEISPEGLKNKFITSLGRLTNASTQEIVYPS